MKSPLHLLPVLAHLRVSLCSPLQSHLARSHIYSHRSCLSASHFHTSPGTHQMNVTDVVRVLEKVAPSWQAESWDNVGLLVEPSSSQIISRLVITNDLTEEVLDEVEERWKPVNQCLVVAYHPPIFKPLKSLTQRSSTERVLVRSLAAGLTVYSPHTALDNKEEGMTDWLLSGLGEGEVRALGVNKHPVTLSSLVEVNGLKETDKEDLLKTLMPYCKGDHVKVSVREKDLGPILSLLNKWYPKRAVSISSSTEVLPSLSGGKLLTLKEPSSLSVIAQRIKDHLKLPHIRLARPQLHGEDPVIKTIAACPGSGGSVLEKVKADLLLTGEMSHHQVLAATGRGVAVALCEHSNTERGYLRGNYKKELEQAFAGSLDIVFASSDKDPLEIV